MSDDILKAIREGRYHDALGLSEYARRLEIEGRAARLADTWPRLAPALSGIVQLLTRPEKKRIYRIACALRDDALRELEYRFGPWLLQALPGCRARAWASVQRILRCNGESGEVSIGPRAARSLARNARDWVVEEVINQECPTIRLTPKELAAGRATRSFFAPDCPDCRQTGRRLCTACAGGTRPPANAGRPVLALAPDFKAEVSRLLARACSRCGGRGSIPCACEEDYLFCMPLAVQPGDVLVGVSRGWLRVIYRIVDWDVYSERPSVALRELYSRYDSPGKGDESGRDPRLEEARLLSADPDLFERAMARLRWLLLVALGFLLGGGVGALFDPELGGHGIGVVFAWPMAELVRRSIRSPGKREARGRDLRLEEARLLSPEPNRFQRLMARLLWLLLLATGFWLGGAVGALFDPDLWGHGIGVLCAWPMAELARRSIRSELPTDRELALAVGALLGTPLLGYLLGDLVQSPLAGLAIGGCLTVYAAFLHALDLRGGTWFP